MMKNSQCDAPGHETCNGWIICDHTGVELEPAEGDSPEWCPRCDNGVGEPAAAWCPQRTN